MWEPLQVTLFELPGEPCGSRDPTAEPPMRVARVVPDVPAMDRELDYSVPEGLASRLRVGSVVRVPLHGRRVRGWVVALGADPAEGILLEPVARFSGLGPDAATVDLARWAAWRWAGRLPSLLRAATPPRAVRAAASQRARGPRGGEGSNRLAADLLAVAGHDVTVLEVSPTEDPLPVAIAAAARGQSLFVAPSLRSQRRVADGLRAAGATVARWPDEFAGALAGHHVVGGRAAVFAPLAELSAVVVWDEHDEGLQNESSPTWHARELAIERARRAGVPCLLVSPCPSLEARALATGGVRRGDAVSRRQGWAALVIADRRGEDRARNGLFSPAFVEAARRTRSEGQRVVCVLNRTGRARLLACKLCSVLATCEACGAAVRQPDTASLVCERCGTKRPVICLACGSTAMRVLRAGVSRAREDLEALMREPVEVISGPRGAQDAAGGPHSGVLIGTEAVLHRVRRVGLVAFLDFDQELLAPRYRAAEEALALLVLASRAVGGRRDAATVMVQTDLADHEVLRAVTRAAPEIVAEAELPRRALLGMPPAGAVAAVGGEAAGEFVQRMGRPNAVGVQGPRDGWWLLRAPNPEQLSDALAAVVRPPGRLRLRIDPVRLP